MELLLVPIDFSAGTEKVLAAAHRLAVATGATLRLLHVAPPDPDGLWDQRLTQASSRRAPVDEVFDVVDRYR